MRIDYQKNALLSLNNHIATIVPEAEIQTPRIKSIITTHVSGHRNIITSSIDLVDGLADDIIKDIIGDISTFIYNEYGVKKDTTEPLVQMLIDDALGGAKTSIQQYKSKILNTMDTLSSSIQMLMTDDIMSLFTGEGVNVDTLTKKISGKLDLYLPKMGGIDLGSYADILTKALDGNVQSYLSSIQNSTLKNNMGDFYNIIKSGNITQSGINDLLHHTIDNIEPYANKFVGEWNEFIQLADKSLDPINEFLFKETGCFKTNVNMLKQLKHEYSKSVDAQSIAIQTENANKGFCDPMGIHPPPVGTLTPFNSTFQVLNTIAMSTPTWTTANGKEVSQPTTTKNSKYPHNTKNVSPSGHITEIDDTPGHERIMQQHKSGSMTETDAGGNVVHKIVGDKYSIVDKNGYIYIEGSCDVVVNGGVTLKTSNSMGIKILGDANIDVHGSANIGVGVDCKIDVAKDFIVNAENIILHAHKDIRMKADGEIIHESIGDMSFKSAKSIKNESALSINNKVGKNFIVDSGTSIMLKTDKIVAGASSIGLKASGDFIAAADGLYLSGSSIDVKSSGALNMDGSVSYWQSGKAASKSVAAPTAAEPALPSEVALGKFSLEQLPLHPPYIENAPQPTQFKSDVLPPDGDIP